MDRDRLKRLAADKRFIPGIYNYCDRWCERCPQTSRCLNFSMLEEEFSDPETRDIRNEAFWKKLSEVFGKTLELLTEAGKEWGIELETSDTESDAERMRANEEAAENHLVCRAAKRYSQMVGDWFQGKEGSFLETVSAANRGLDIEEAFEVIQWYQHFIAAKVIRAIQGKMEEDEEGRDDEFASDSDGSAKIALVAIDRSMSAWAVISRDDHGPADAVFQMISFLDRLRQAVEKTFPKARSFIRPGFDRIDPKD